MGRADAEVGTQYQDSRLERGWHLGLSRCRGRDLRSGLEEGKRSALSVEQILRTGPETKQRPRLGPRDEVAS